MLPRPSKTTHRRVDEVQNLSQKTWVPIPAVPLPTSVLGQVTGPLKAQLAFSALRSVVSLVIPKPGGTPETRRKMSKVPIQGPRPNGH